jgi:hypothetical protein
MPAIFRIRHKLNVGVSAVRPSRKAVDGLDTTHLHVPHISHDDRGTPLVPAIAIIARSE